MCGTAKDRGKTGIDRRKEIWCPVNERESADPWWISCDVIFSPRRCVRSKIRPNDATLSRYHRAGWEIPSDESWCKQGRWALRPRALWKRAKVQCLRYFSGCERRRRIHLQGCIDPAVRWGEKRGGEGGGGERTVSRRYPGICAGQSWNAHRVKFMIRLEFRIGSLLQDLLTYRFIFLIWQMRFVTYRSIKNV